MWDVQVDITWRDRLNGQVSETLADEAHGTITISEPTRWRVPGSKCFWGTYEIPIDSIIFRADRESRRAHGCVRPEERQVVIFLGGGIDAGEVILTLARADDTLRGVLSQSFIGSRGGQGTVVMRRRVTDGSSDGPPPNKR